MPRFACHRVSSKSAYPEAYRAGAAGKVFPDEVDEVLMGHPAVLEAATIGVPDAERGETVKSFIVLNEGASLTAEEVEAYARDQLAAYKIPRKVEFLDELPKSSVMKILRRELRDREEQNG